MKSFDDFLSEYRKESSDFTLADIDKNITNSGLANGISTLASLFAALDKRSEDRLRAYHEWANKD